MDPLWTRRPPATRGPKPGLSLDRIVDEAVALADSDGLAAVSMKALAGRLGAGTMSLYRYLPGKDDLLALMLDRVIGAPAAELSSLAWRDALRRWAYDSWAMFHRHPWVIGVIASSRVVGPNELAWAEAALAVLARAEAPPQTRLDIIFAVNGYVRGTAQLSAYSGQGPRVDMETVIAAGRLEEYPALADLTASMSAEPDYDHRTEATFSLGLELLLDGIGRLIDAT